MLDCHGQLAGSANFGKGITGVARVLVALLIENMTGHRVDEGRLTAQII